MKSSTLASQTAAVHRNVVVAAVGFVTLVVFSPVLKSLIVLALHDERYLQVMVAPFACFLLLYLCRSEVFSTATYSPRLGIPLVSVSILLGMLLGYFSFSSAAGRTLDVFAMILTCMSAFILSCGVDGFRAALYPLGTLFLMVPLPSAWMDRLATFLQHGSAAVAYRMLQVTSIPVLRHGMVFSLPGLDFEVAPECSGLHSSLALLMIAVVTAGLCLRFSWSRMALIVLTVPIAIVKNAVRITVITWLASRVDRAFIDGPFHHQYGGIVFSVPGVALFVLCLGGLRIVERSVLR